ncbi:MAG: ATP-binding protein [Bacteroidales bacterium]|nr:ATP-binding protein [Bacteroidales bacterium]
MHHTRLHHVKRLISEGEHQHLDFKFEISDAAKIARSLVAFANTDGGTLLIGVKDNGSLKGIQSGEELYMVQRASKNFCQPEVVFASKEWILEGKKILEVKVPVSKQLPHRAPDTQGNYKVFVRIHDQNMMASGIQMKIWKKQQSDEAVQITYNQQVKELLSLVESQPGLGINELKAKLNVSKHKLEELLADLIVMKVIQIGRTGNELVFQLCE